MGNQALTDDCDAFIVHLLEASSEVLAASVTLVAADESGQVPTDGADRETNYDNTTHLSVPLMQGDQLMSRRQRQFSDDEGLCADAIGVTAASALSRYNSEEQVRHASLHDALTGLPNRTLFLRALEETVTGSPSAPASILFIDLDRFKRVNDHLGHRAGDELLVAVSDECGACCKVISCSHGWPVTSSSCSVAGRTRRLMPQRLAGLIAARLAQPFALRAGVAEIGASVGTATHDGREDFQHLMHRADTAMYAEGGYRVT